MITLPNFELVINRNNAGVARAAVVIVSGRNENFFLFEGYFQNTLTIAASAWQRPRVVTSMQQLSWPRGRRWACLKPNSPRGSGQRRAKSPALTKHLFNEYPAAIIGG